MAAGGGCDLQLGSPSSPPDPPRFTRSHLQHPSPGMLGVWLFFLQGGRPTRTGAGFAGWLGHEFQLSQGAKRTLKLTSADVQQRVSQELPSRASKPAVALPPAPACSTVSQHRFWTNPIRIRPDAEPIAAGIDPRHKQPRFHKRRQRRGVKLSAAGRREQCWSLECWRHPRPCFAAPGQGGDKATAAGMWRGGSSSLPPPGCTGSKPSHLLQCQDGGK